MAMTDAIKWKRTNAGNLLFALYKGKVKRLKAVLTWTIGKTDLKYVSGKMMCMI